jgi:hypothetical protein
LMILHFLELCPLPSCSILVVIEPTFHHSEHGFLSQVVDLAFYRTCVLGLKPLPGGLSSNPWLKFVYPSRVSLFVSTKQKLKRNSPTCFCMHEWVLLIPLLR